MRRIVCCARAASGQRRRAAEQRDELAPTDHSITSSARASSVGGTVEAESLGGLEVDDQLVLGSLLHGQVGWFGALENFVDVGSGTPSQIDVVWRVAHEASRHHIFPRAEISWQSILQRELGQKHWMRSGRQRRRVHKDTIALFPRHRCQCPLKVVCSCNRYHLELYPKRFAGRFYRLQDSTV